MKKNDTKRLLCCFLTACQKTKTPRNEVNFSRPEFIFPEIPGPVKLALRRKKKKETKHKRTNSCGQQWLGFETVGSTAAAKDSVDWVLGEREEEKAGGWEVGWLQGGEAFWTSSRLPPSRLCWILATADHSPAKRMGVPETKPAFSPALSPGRCPTALSSPLPCLIRIHCSPPLLNFSTKPLVRKSN